MPQVGPRYSVGWDIPPTPARPDFLARSSMTPVSYTHLDVYKRQVFYLVKVDNAKFSKMVVPGDRLELDVELKRRIRNMAQYVGCLLYTS